MPPQSSSDYVGHPPPGRIVVGQMSQLVRQHGVLLAE
jgi:hypothetical protein